MPNCLTTAPNMQTPWLISARAGLIKLKLTGTVFFDPAQTDVITANGQKVAFTCTAQEISFTAVSGSTYYLEILHAGTMPTSTGDLIEDCDAQVRLATLSPASTYSRYQIVVA